MPVGEGEGLLGGRVSVVPEYLASSVVSVLLEVKVATSRSLHVSRDELYHHSPEASLSMFLIDS